MLTEKQHQEWKEDLIKLHEVEAENTKLKEQVMLIDRLRAHYKSIGFSDTAGRIEQALKG